ncbi:MAG: SDR family oxidoreductase [Sulfurimicrobium sp.]|nr:SDR family oxidoreductase [Sulfurimicrobium sp.]MDP1703927.1 SDR family oxidoreductase [Sulfurimicrobium sp.]MDP2197446.1 SDR family oxidoreductase [Sulfurimicrobium sp.]MDP3686656.1 SDR family oxidoreductase [Sulfurimicrobium sp.]MDZ7654319.1 SDR family oxidoreductase [Sulfurimicrobium sp.]
MTKFQAAQQYLRGHQHHWLITGVAGFIGSNLLEALLRLNQKVTGMDNFSTGYRHNLEQVQELVGPEAWRNFTFIEGDIRKLEDCANACKKVDFVLHEAALGSVPRSIEDPILTNENNVSGFLNMLVASRDAPVKRFVFAASSSTYGDHPDLPKVESVIGKPLSPYAVTKYVNELYADVFARCYGTESIGLRYFNIFGPRQDPNGAYAAVIPQWVAALIRNQTLYINGDGETSRDFCFIDNVVQANLLAALADNPEAANQVYNVALNERTSLNQLYEMMRSLLQEQFPHLETHRPQHVDFREGDVRHSQADISKAARLLGFEPTHRIDEGLKQAMDWYVAHLAPE